MPLFLDHLRRDLRLAFRQLGRRPGLSAAAILALSCGIGAVTTVFALVDAVVLRPLPVASPGELVWLRTPGFSFPIYREVRDRGHLFAGLFAWERRTLLVEWTGEPEASPVLLATGGIHETLGIRPVRGRLLRNSDAGDSAAEAQPVAVLSHRAWERRFGSHPGIVGRTIRIEGQPFTIVGVTPPGFFGVAVGASPDVTIPMTMLPRLRSDERDILAAPARAWLHIMGRLRPGLSIAQADAAFQSVWPQVLNATTDPGLAPERRARFLSRQAGLMPGAAGFSPVRNQFREPLWLLFGLVGLLLVVACATVANLLLATGTARQRELALRLAVGAGRGRLVQQLFVEGLVLAAIGGTVGLAFAAWAGELLVALGSTSRAPIVIERAIDWRVLGFTATAVGAATVAFTLLPILRAARVDPGLALRSGGRGTLGPSGWWTARSLVVVQVAVSLTLLVGSALFARDLHRLLARDAGFDRENLLVVSVDVLSRAGRSGRGAIDLPSFYAELLDRLKAVPGVQSASLSWVPPISNELGAWTRRIGIDGAEPADDSRGTTYFNAISPGYFRTVGTALVAGRDVAWTDRDGWMPVVIVNESLARSLFGGANPIGRRISIGQHASRQNLEIVGLVRDAAYQRLQEPPRRIAYLPYLQLPEFLAGSNLVAEVRADGAAEALVPRLAAAVRAQDPSLAMRIERVADRIDESLVRERLLATIATFLGVVSMLLACGALAGLMSHVVGSRTVEIGLRMALGADRRRVAGLIVREGLILVLPGGAAGLALAHAGGRFVAHLLHDVRPGDPWSVAAAATVMLVTAALAGYLPARRAARVDPIRALRSE